MGINEKNNRTTFSGTSQRLMFGLPKLKDLDEAAAYLNVALEESLKGDEESQHLFLIALRNVAEAQG